MAPAGTLCHDRTATTHARGMGHCHHLDDSHYEGKTMTKHEATDLLVTLGRLKLENTISAQTEKIVAAARKALAFEVRQADFERSPLFGGLTVTGEGTTTL